MTARAFSRLAVIWIAAVALAAAGAPHARELEAPGPLGPLRGAYLDAGKGAAAVLIIPGSGPTNRDGNGPLVRTDAYKMLAEALRAEGISSLRIDKRGMFRSAAAIKDPNAVTIAAYASDVRAWGAVLRRVSGQPCVWIAGHSEGGLVALKAVEKPAGVCGVILLTAPGRPLGALLREQLAANPLNLLILPHAYWALAQLEAGRMVDPAALPAAIRPLFRRAAQPYLIDLLAYDPAKLAAAYKGPLLIVHAGLDAQVRPADADALQRAAPHARRVDLPFASHVLKRATSADRLGAAKSYADPSIPLAPGLAPAIRAFIAATPPQER